MVVETVLTERFCCVPSSAKTHRVVWTRLRVVVSIQAAALCLQEWVFVFCAGGDWGYTRSQLPGWHWHWWHWFLQLPLSPSHKSVLLFSYLFNFYTCTHALVDVSNFLCDPTTSQWGGFLLIFTLVHMHWLRFQTPVTWSPVSVFFFFSSYFSNFLCQLATSHRFLVLISTLVHMQR